MGKLYKYKNYPQNKPKNRIPTIRVSVVIINEKQEILLVLHKKPSCSYWVLPGGRLEYGETLTQCAIREIKEETNLEIMVERFIFLSEAIAPNKSRHIVNFYVKARVIGGTMQLGDDPVLEAVDYVSIHELDKITLFPPVHHAILRAASNKLIEGIEYLGNLWV